MRSAIVEKGGLLIPKTRVDVKRNSAILPFVLALVYALLMTTFPWERITGHEFLDKEVYVSKFDYGTPVVEEQGIQDLRGFLVYEALWDIAVRWAADNTPATSEDVLIAVSFACFFVFSKYLFERHNPILCALFLLNPILIDFGMSQLRMALAATLLLIAFNARGLAWKLLLAATAIFLHTASIIFIMIYFFTYWMSDLVCDRRLTKRAVSSLLVLFGLAIVFAVGPARQVILGYLGDRRMEYEAASSSLLFGGFWAILLAFQVVQRRQYFFDKANLYSIVVVSTFVFSVILGVYGSRFVAAAFPLVASSMMLIKSEHRPALFSLFGVYELVQWYYWTL